MRIVPPAATAPSPKRWLAAACATVLQAMRDGIAARAQAISGSGPRKGPADRALPAWPKK